MKKQKEKDIEFASTIGDSSIQLEIIGVEGKKLKRKEELIREASHQREQRLISFQLPFYNKYNVLKCIKLDNGSSTQNIEGVRDVRRTMKLLREVQIQVGVEKIDICKGVSVKVLLDSGATVLFADRKFVEKQRFKKEKLARPIQIRNMDGTDNSRGIVIYEIKYNLYYKGHVE